MKSTYFLSVLIAFAIPMAISAEEADSSRFKAEGDFTPAQDCFSLCCDECCPPCWSLQARGAAYFPLQKHIREIYGTALPTVELEASYNICSWDCSQLLLWGNLGWTFATGVTRGFRFHSHLHLLPISLGLEYEYNLWRNLDFYLGVGPTYSWLLIQNKDGFSTSHKHKSQFGVTTKTGFRYTFCRNFFLDVFGDFFYTPFGHIHDHIHSMNANFTGFFVGGGLGYKW